jgi:hypothetical protein
LSVFPSFLFFFVLSSVIIRDDTRAHLCNMSCSFFFSFLFFSPALHHFSTPIDHQRRTVNSCHGVGHYHHSSLTIFCPILIFIALMPTIRYDMLYTILHLTTETSFFDSCFFLPILFFQPPSYDLPTHQHQHTIILSTLSCPYGYLFCLLLMLLVHA